MYIAMNNFRVHASRTGEFEDAWRSRESFLAGVLGFREFHLLRGPVDETGARLYASHTVWEDEASFRAWTESEAFRKAHAQGTVSGLLAAPPKFVGWEVVPT
jgi:heme-degrading monooxygenase HmoA